MASQKEKAMCRIRDAREPKFQPRAPEFNVHRSMRKDFIFDLEDANEDQAGSDASDYEPPNENNNPKPSQGKAKKSTGTKQRKQTVLTQCWEKIEKLAAKGNKPADIAKILNQDLEEASHLTGKQVSDKIHRMKNFGQAGAVKASSAGIDAQAEDCMFES